VSELHIDMRSYRWIGYGFFILALPCIFPPLLSSQYLVSLLFAVFAAIGLYLGMVSGTYVIDQESLSLDTRLGRWRMEWSEVTSAQYGGMGTLVLIGAGKRFALAPPGWWPRLRREEAYRFVLDQLARHQIVPSRSRIADYLWMKNTRT
jgi:hypothetical protein